MAQKNMEFPSNTNSERRVERPKVESVVHGTSKVQKGSLTSRIVKAFFNDDVKSLPERIVFDVAIPAAQNLMMDTLTEAVTQVFGGGSRRTQRIRPGYTSYSSANGSRISYAEREPSRRARATHDFDSIVHESREDAENVLDQMGELVDYYDVCSVADMYELSGVSPEYTDRAWGWDDLRTASIRRTRTGYIIDLPRPKAIES